MGTFNESFRWRNCFSNNFLFYDGFSNDAFLFLNSKNLANTSGEILNKAKLAHILSLKISELRRHIICVDIFIARNEYLAPVSLHKRKESAPFVLDPDGVVIFFRSSDGKHDFCAVQSRKYVRLVFLTEFVLKRYTGKENLESFCGKSVINILRKNAVHGSVTFGISFFVADENVKRLFTVYDGENALLESIDDSCFGIIYFLCNRVGKLNCSFEVAVVKNAFKCSSVAGGDFLSGSRVINIFYSEFAKAKAPVSFCFLGEFGDNVFINACCSVKFVCDSKAVCSVEKISFLFAVAVRNSLGSSAIFTFDYFHSFGDFKIAATHFTFEYCHFSVLRIFISMFGVLRLSV